MKCWKCGADVAPGAVFCASCGARQEQDAPNSPVTPPPAGGDAGNGIVLTIFAAICMAVCGGLALRSLFAALGGLFHIGWAGIFGTIRIVGLNGLTAVMLVLMAIVCALTAFKRTSRNSDGLLVCLAISSAGYLAVQLLSMIVSIVIYPGGIGTYFGGFVLAILGVAAALGGIYAIERFLLGEFPIIGKSMEDLQADVREAMNSFRETAGEVGAQASQAAQNAKAEREARAAQQQAQYAAQQAQYNQYNQYQQPGPGGPQYQQTPPPPPGYAPFRLKADRSLIAYILLNFLTCGIYSWYFIYALARDVNAACAGDGRSTAGLLKLILLSFITCGFYSLYWYYALGNRLPVRPGLPGERDHRSAVAVHWRAAVRHRTLCGHAHHHQEHQLPVRRVQLPARHLRSCIQGRLTGKPAGRLFMPASLPLYRTIAENRSGFIKIS